MTDKKEKISKLEVALITAMQALDNQIARAMNRGPEQREVHGVQKWEPMTQRVEQCCVTIIDAMGDEQIQLDSILVLAQAFSKALYMYIEDLEGQDMGKLRTSYCLSALENILNDVSRGQKLLKGDPGLN